MRRGHAIVIVGVVLLVGGCTGWFADRMPDSVNPTEVKRITIEVVARNNRCEPSVMAIDREGKAVLVTFQITSVGKEHVFLIPELSVRRRVPADSQVAIELLADRSGIYQYACNSQPWIGPFATTGKLAVR